MKSLQKYATPRNNFTRTNLLMLLGALVLFLGFSVQVSAQVGAQVALKPRNILQFVDPLPHFAYPGARVDATSGHLTISMEPHEQIALSIGTVLPGGGIVGTPGIGVTKVWAYMIDDGTNTYGPLWPAHTIVTRRGVPLNVTYENNLGGQTYANVGLVVDQTLHWANPSEFDGSNPPAVVHLHGGEVASEYDGGPDSWFTPGYLKTGPAWNAGVTQNYEYGNTQEATTLWFHDHALGVTRLNVYAGMAGFYFLKDDAENDLHLPGWSDDNLVQQLDRVTGEPVGDPYLPEIEIAIQDRMFDTNGQLYFPNLPPNPDIHPYWTPEFVGDIITVNGKTWPYLSVAPRKYRFRFLNGSNARFYELWLQDLATGTVGPIIYQIGTDGGLLDIPVPIDPTLGGKLLLGPGERADVVIDFSASPGAVWTLRNSGRTPFPKGGPPNGSTVGRIMQFVVNGQLQGADKSQLPPTLRATPLVKLTNFAGGLNVTPAKKRQLTLNEVIGVGGPLEVLVNNTMWDAPVTEMPTEGTSEVWQIINLTADAHPIHLHLVQFQLVSRQKFNLNKYLKVYTAIPGEGPQYDYIIPNADGAVGGNPAISPYLQGPVKPANPNERGWKDTFIMFPGEVTTVVARWAPTDIPANTTDPNELLYHFDPSTGPGYVWHCHIIDHEDNEMMRPYKVTASLARSLTKFGAEPIAAEQTPESFNLNQNFPNPFNPSTSITFTLPAAGEVKLAIYNIRGDLVQNLVDGRLESGMHRIVWNSTDANGNRVASGVYFYRLSVNGFVSQKKLVLTK